MRIVIDNLVSTEIEQFLEQHLDDMKAVSPPESKHALDMDGLRQPDVTFWTVWDGESLAGCGALKMLDEQHAELKSMRTDAGHKNKGVASKLLQHIMAFAESGGVRRVSLETGSMPFFEPARKLYLKHGFSYCPPFADYKEDPNSLFMTKTL